MAAQPGYCLFVSKPTGYELVDREGEPPALGSTVELDGQGRWEVNRIGQERSLRAHNGVIPKSRIDCMTCSRHLT